MGTYQNPCQYPAIKCRIDGDYLEVASGLLEEPHYSGCFITEANAKLLVENLQRALTALQELKRQNGIKD